MRDMTVKSQIVENGKWDFANGLSDITDQLRLMEQKLTMITDDCIQERYEEHQKNLHHITYSLNKLSKGQTIQNKKIAPRPFVLKNAKKKLS